MNDIKVALCLFGQPRFIESMKSIDSHKKHIIDKYNVDVFCHTWIYNEGEYYDSGDWTQNIKSAATNKSIDLIIEHYNPKFYDFEFKKNLKVDDSDLYKVVDKRNFNENNERAVLSHLYSMSKSIDLISDINQYDFIILSRYDNFIYDFPDLYNLDNNRIYLNAGQAHFCDIIIFGGPNQIKTQSVYNKISSLYEKLYEFSPESFKGAAFFNEFNEVGRIHIGVDILESGFKCRSYNG